MYYFSKVGNLCALIGLGGVVTTVTNVAVEGTYKAVRKKFDLQAWLEDHTHQCYKWIYYGSTTNGELQACEDKSSTSSGSPSLSFYLWWLGGGAGNNKWFEVEKIIEVDSSNSISFKFKNGDHTDKKLKIHPKSPPQLKESVTKLTNTNKTLKEICKINGSNLICTDSDGGKSYTLNVQPVTSYF